jgi:hypothetical protein
VDITIYLPDELGQWAKDNGLKLSQMLRAEVERVRRQQDEPQPSIVVEAVAVQYWRPRVTMPDGQTIVCQHMYLHANERAAAQCGRKIAANGAFIK